MADIKANRRFEKSLNTPRHPGNCSLSFHGSWGIHDSGDEQIWPNDPVEFWGGIILGDAELHSQDVPYGDEWMTAAFVETKDYVVVEREEYETRVREYDDLRARVAALESAIQHWGSSAIPQVTPGMKEAAMSVSRQVFGKATLEPSEEGDHYRVKVAIPSTITPPEGAKLMAKWLRNLRTVSPELAEGVFQLEMEFE